MTAAPRRRPTPAARGSAPQFLDDDDEYFARQPARRSELPDPEPLLRNLTRCVIEVLAGARDLEQLARWVNDDVYRNLLEARRARRPCAPGRRARPRSDRRSRSARVTTCEPRRRRRRGCRDGAPAGPFARGRHPPRGPRPALARERDQRALTPTRRHSATRMRSTERCRRRPPRASTPLRPVRMARRAAGSSATAAQRPLRSCARRSARFCGAAPSPPPPSVRCPNAPRAASGSGRLGSGRPRGARAAWPPAAPGRAGCAPRRRRTSLGAE